MRPPARRAIGSAWFRRPRGRAAACASCGSWASRCGAEQLLREVTGQPLSFEPLVDQSCAPPRLTVWRQPPEALSTAGLPVLRARARRGRGRGAGATRRPGSRRRPAAARRTSSPGSGIRADQNVARTPDAGGAAARQRRAGRPPGRTGAAAPRPPCGTAAGHSRVDQHAPDRAVRRRCQLRERARWPGASSTRRRRTGARPRPSRTRRRSTAARRRRPNPRRQVEAGVAQVGREVADVVDDRHHPRRQQQGQQRAAATSGPRRRTRRASSSTRPRARPRRPGSRNERWRSGAKSLDAR